MLKKRLNMQFLIEKYGIFLTLPILLCLLLIVGLFCYKGVNDVTLKIAVMLSLLSNIIFICVVFYVSFLPISKEFY